MIYHRMPGKNGSPRWQVEGIGLIHRIRDAKAKKKSRRGLDGPRFQRKTNVGDVFISTVGDWWVGVLGKRIPLGYGGGLTELWYETMAFVNGSPDIQRRYLTEEEALAGHNEAVALYRGWNKK